MPSPPKGDRTARPASICSRQQGYYQALQASREPEIDAAVFIDYMLGVIRASLTAYEARARSEVDAVGVNVGVNDAILLLLLRSNRP